MRIINTAPTKASAIATPILNPERRKISILFNQPNEPKFTTITRRLRGKVRRARRPFLLGSRYLVNHRPDAIAFSAQIV